MSETYNLSQTTQRAIQAFEEVERVRFLLDKKEKALSMAVMGMAHDEAPDEDKTAYFNATTEVLSKYETKREKEGL